VTGTSTAVPTAEPRTTYLVIDGENLDATLGNSLLGRRPAPDERPRWERVMSFTEQAWGQPVKALFFLNASSGSLPMPFIQALMAMGLRPVPLSGPPGMKVVDVGIQRMLDAITGRDADVVLGSHDGDFLPQVTALLGGSRKVAVLGFSEFVNSGYAELAQHGLQVFDLEHDAKAFTKPLPRVRILDIDAFDPAAFL
jgi:putative heme uptake system protein